jgi:hypothetical protein
LLPATSETFALRFWRSNLGVIRIGGKLKKLLVLVLSTVFVIAAAGCSATTETSSGNPGEGSETTTNSEADAESTEESGGIEVDEGLLTVDITFPESFVSMGDTEMTQESVDASAAEQGYLGGKLNDDGSVTYTMTKLKQRELLDQMKSDFDDSIQETLAEYPNVKSVTRNDDFSEISIEVTEEDFATGFLAFGFSFTAYFYQVLDGKEFKTDIVYVDASSGEELSRTTYPLED